MDQDQNGTIDFQEFLEMMKKQIQAANTVGEDLSDPFKIIDKDGDGLVSS